MHIKMNKKLFPYIIGIALMVCASCKGDSDGASDSQGSDDIKITGVKVTAFTASVSGKFSGLSKVDIALGKHGVLYCVKSDKAEAIFKSWMDGNDPQECQVYENKNGFSGETFSGKINGLYPETEYSFCLFSQGQDGKRKISSAATFTTERFNPEFSDLWIEDIHYIDAKVRSSVKMNAADAPSCKRGIVISETAGSDIQSAASITEVSEQYNSKNPTFNTVTYGIKPDMTYYCRVFVKYKAADGMERYLFGPEKSFSTLRSENMVVDLGLPSGIMWANCDLGESLFNVDYRTDDMYFYWGSSTLVGRYAIDLNAYEYWNASTGSYVNIGSDICGTEYDMAHVMLGGKWRLPRKEDVEELINNCNTRSFAELSAAIWIEDSQIYANDTWYAGNIVGPNKSKIMLQDGYSFWTGTLCDDGLHVYTFSYVAKEWISTSVKVDKGEITIRESNRERSCKIRPVWDPNM